MSYRKREGEYAAAFSFDNVPSGNYELSLKPLDNLRWEVLTMTISPPAEGLESICEDDTPTFDLEFRAIDDQTGAPIEESWNIVWQGDPLKGVRLNRDWETDIYKAVPEGISLQWVLRAEGYQLATGWEPPPPDLGNRRATPTRAVRFVTSPVSSVPVSMFMRLPSES